MAAISRQAFGFAAQSWLTFRQAWGLGGNVRKGEHGTTVVYADRIFANAGRSTTPSGILMKSISMAAWSICGEPSTRGPAPVSLPFPIRNTLICKSQLSFRNAQQERDDCTSYKRVVRLHRPRKARIVPYNGPAGGRRAIKATIEILLEQGVAIKGSKMLFKRSQPKGFDYPGCGVA
jgi:N-terminal domain of anti-restriction factor ArdC